MMHVLNYEEAFIILGELPLARIAVYDTERQACYALPIAFVPQPKGVVIATHQHGKLAHLLTQQPSGVCIEADDIKPHLAFRSVMGTATVESITDPLNALTQLAQRYGAQWGRWRPVNPIHVFFLRIHALQGRIAD